MKKLALVLLILFLLLAALYAVSQSNIGRHFVQNLVTRNLKQAGFTVQIDQVEGTLPHHIKLKGVTLEGKEGKLRIASLSLRPVLWRFLKREIAFDKIQAQGISIEDKVSFDFIGQFRMNQKNAYLKGKCGDWDLAAHLYLPKHLLIFHLRNPLLQTKGQAQFDDTYQLNIAKIQLSSDQLLSHLPFLKTKARILSNLVIQRQPTGFKARARWHIPHWQLKGQAETTLVGRKISGELTATPYAKMQFDGEVNAEGFFLGTTQIAMDNLQALHLPDLYGKIEVDARWQPLDQGQGLNLQASASNFYYGTQLFCERAILYADWQDFFHQTNRAKLDLEVENGKWKKLELETAHLKVGATEQDWPFVVTAKGKWEHPLEVQMNGSWKKEEELTIDTLTGTFFAYPYALTQPAHLQYKTETFLLPEVELTLGPSKAIFAIQREKGHTEAKITLQEMPLALFSLNPLETPMTGTLNLETHIEEGPKAVKGQLRASVVQTAPFAAQGMFNGNFDRDILSVNGQVYVQKKPLLNLELSLPIHFSLWPLHADLLYHKSLQGHIALDAQVEEFLDFIDLGPHRLEGHCQCDLTLKNTLNRPLMEGHCQFSQGTYENYYTGTYLQNIQAEIDAQKNTLFLRSLTGQDPPHKGSLFAKGQLALNKADLFPFSLDVQLDQLQFTAIDLVTASAEGAIHIEGNTSSALVKGGVEILQTELIVPDHIPQPLPELQVVYRNATHPVPPPETKYKPYPLFLDLQVKAPQTVSISGRGLNSQWSGDFHLGGTYTNLAAKGKLALLSGEFNFSSRSFKLTEGSLIFSGIEGEIPHLDLVGEIETKGILIAVRLKGPLNNPQITLQSTPPLPLGSIMSYLLFGQDLSEISGFQALQLASSLASLAGTGPDLLENTRRSLGMDRLRLITDPTEEGGETISLQVGKYVSEGVLVSFTQGAEDSSPDISVEIELRGNFVFQIESDQHQEQGKFTLKWSRNY